MPRRAFLPERPALRRLDGPAQHVPGPAKRRLLSMNPRNLEPFLGVELAISGAHPPAAFRNHADPPPSPVRHLKNLAQQFLRRTVALERDHPLVRVLHLVPSGLQLHHRAANPVQQIQRLEPRHHQRNPILLGQRRILPVTHHAAKGPPPRRTACPLSPGVPNGSSSRWGWPGDSMMAEIAGGTNTCETSSEKFFNPRRLARCTLIALAGAVVSNPTPKNTTCLSGFLAANSTASSGEYTTRTSPPRPLT